MADREIEKAFRERGRGEERGERVAMHGRERIEKAFREGVEERRGEK